MRQLQYTININQFKAIKHFIVPTLFTHHQFQLIEKKFTKKPLTDSEKNEFSRTISKKMKAINKILEKETKNTFIYNKEKINPQKLNLAIKYLKKFSRKFKNKHIIISGSFLYSNKFNDIDIFVISKYEKQDYKINNFHINYLTEDVYSSLFFESLRKLCISNKILKKQEIKEKISLDTFISLYQELFNDLDKRFKGIRSTLREFLLQASFIENSPIPDSLELKDQIQNIIKSKKPKEIVKKIFVKSTILYKNKKQTINSMKEMIHSYDQIMKEYKQHKSYYLDLTQSFKEVLSIET